MLDLVTATDIIPNALSFVLMAKQNSASFCAGDTHIRFDSLSSSMVWPLDLPKLVASYIIQVENAVATLLADNFSTDRIYTYCPPIRSVPTDILIRRAEMYRNVPTGVLMYRVEIYRNIKDEKFVHGLFTKTQIYHPGMRYDETR